MAITKCGFSSVKRAGRPCYDDLNIDFGHGRIRVDEKGDCIACAKIGHSQSLPRSEWRHQSRVIYSFFKVYLCVEIVSKFITLW